MQELEFNDDWALTTIDNPYDPFDDFDRWYKWDEEMGYHSCGLLARIACVSDSLIDEENERIIREAMQDICRITGGLYTIKVKSLTGEGV